MQPALDTSGGSLDNMNSEVAAWVAGKGHKPEFFGRRDVSIWSQLIPDSAPDTSKHCDGLRKQLAKLDGGGGSGGGDGDDRGRGDSAIKRMVVGFLNVVVTIVDIQCARVGLQRLSQIVQITIN